MKRQFSSEARTEFTRLKAKIHEDLKRQQPDSAAIVETGRDMARIRREQWYLMDDIDDPDQWAHATFGIYLRQTGKYFAIGERLRPEQVAGAGLGLEALYQLALAPEGLRGPLLKLAVEEKLASGAMSAGRLAALPLWEDGDEEGAREKMAEKAVDRQVRDDAEKAEKKKAKAGPRTPEQIVAAAQSALARAEKELAKLAEVEGRPLSEEARKLMEGAQEQVAGAQEQVAQLLLRVAEEAAPADEEEKEETKEPDMGPTASAVSNCRSGPTNSPEPAPAKSESIDLAPLITAVDGCHGSDKSALSRYMFFLMRGDCVEKIIDDLRRLRGPLVEAGVPGDVFDEWLRRVGDPDPDRRGLFILRFHAQAKLPDLGRHVRWLLEKEAELPPRLRQVLRKLVPREDGAGAEGHAGQPP